MLDAETIAQQQQLLAIYRRTVAQLAASAGRYGGESAAPPEVAHGLYEAREHIRHIKQLFRQHSIPIDDMPNDEALTLDDLNKASQRASNPGTQGVFISGGTVHGTVVGVNTGTITTYSGAGASHDTLATIRATLQQALQVAQQSGAYDLADDLEDIARSLTAAAKAQDESKAERYKAKLREARRALEVLMPSTPQLEPIVQALLKLNG